MFVRRFSPLQTFAVIGRPAAEWRSVSTNLVSSQKLVVILAQCRYTKIEQRIFKHSDVQYIVLFWILKTEQFDIYTVSQKSSHLNTLCNFDKY